MSPGQYRPDAGWPEPDGCAEVKTGTERIGTMNADVIDYVDAWTAPQVRSIVSASKPGPISQETNPMLQIDSDMVESACRAHWPSFDRMRPDHAAEKRVKMQAALAAALYGGRLQP